MTTKKYDEDQLYALCDHLNAANLIANAQGLDTQLQDQLSDIQDHIADLALQHGTEIDQQRRGQQ